jgi:hypothetical protein
MVWSVLMCENLKYFGKGTENLGWSVIIPQDSLSFFENEFNGILLPNGRESSL